jgi:HD-GYP domain-containing protein (c-di-GMP phosphodiesterase class II)
MNAEEALAKLRCLSGAQFDADVVPALEAAVSQAPTEPAAARS